MARMCCPRRRLGFSRRIQKKGLVEGFIRRVQKKNSAEGFRKGYGSVEARVQQKASAEDSVQQKGAAKGFSRRVQQRLGFCRTCKEASTVWQMNRTRGDNLTQCFQESVSESQLHHKTIT